MIWNVDTWKTIGRYHLKEWAFDLSRRYSLSVAPGYGGQCYCYYKSNVYKAKSPIQELNIPKSPQKLLSVKQIKKKLIPQSACWSQCHEDMCSPTQIGAECPECVKKAVQIFGGQMHTMGRRLDVGTGGQKTPTHWAKNTIDGKVKMGSGETPVYEKGLRTGKHKVPLPQIPQSTWELVDTGVLDDGSFYTRKVDEQGDYLVDDGAPVIVQQKYNDAEIMHPDQVWAAR